MKLGFRKDDLLEAVNIVSRAVPSRTTNNILECILFDASAGSIVLMASNTELSISTKVEGEIMERGKAAVNAGLITEIIRKCENPDSQIVIDMDPNTSYTITVEADGAVFRFPGRDGDEFPYPEYVEKDRYISISHFTLKEAVRQTAFSAAVNDNNKMMGGALVEVDGTSLKFTTLDGHRVAIRKIEMKDDYGAFSSIIPVKALNEVSKIISSDNDKEVVIYFTDNYVSFEWDETTVITRVIDGEFFRIAHMIKSDYDTKVDINKNRLVGAIDRAMIFVKESEHKPIVLTLEDEYMYLRMRSSLGEMNGEVECEKLGRDLKIAFNPKYILDVLRVLDDENVTLYFTNAKEPCFIRDEAESYIYMILPVNFIE